MKTASDKDSVQKKIYTLQEDKKLVQMSKILNKGA